MLEMALLGRLGLLRKERGLTKQDLADLAGVYLIQKQRHNSGAEQPTLDVMKKLAIALAVLDGLNFKHQARPIVLSNQSHK
jgi:transcriptional regulator with XRE-family HTH domain